MSASDTSPTPATAVAQLREEALSIIERAKGLEKLQEVLQSAGDPRLLDAPLPDDLHRGGLLAWAVTKGEVDYGRILIESGADPMHAAGGDGFGPTHALGLFSYGMSEAAIHSFVEMLAAAGASFDAKDAKGYAPLHYAVGAGSSTLVQLLIERGVPIDPMLLDDASFEATITPREGSGLRPRVIEALRIVRATAMKQNLLSAMPAEPEDGAKPSPGMTL